MNIKQYLEDKGIEYKTAGHKNVTRGWINIQCPFSHCGDKTNHMGINLASGGWNCWICNSSHHDIAFLIKELEKCTLPKAISIVKKYDDGTVYKEEKIRTSSEVWIPTGIVNHWPDEHLEYLHDRKFSESIIELYRLKPIGKNGHYNHRILVPFFINNKIVSWQAADVIRLESGRIPYLDCPPEKSIIPVHHCLYNYDSLTDDKAIIVEGVTDVWRLGKSSIATCTKNFTREQILLLKKKNIKSVFVIYDSDATESAKNLSIILSGVFNHSEYIQLTKGDPADLSYKQVNELKHSIGLKN